MSLSVCVRNVRATSKGGSVTEGNMTCENIDSLKSVGYTIEYLDEPPITDSTASSFEPIQEIEQIVQEPIIAEPIEELPVQAETIQVVKPIYAIYQQDIFDRSLVLAEEITQVKANNIELTNENNNLKQQLENVFTEEQVNKIKLENEIIKIHSIISERQAYAKEGSQQSRKIKWANWVNFVENQEFFLERFADNLGLSYSRRIKVDGEPIYYIKHIYEAVGTTPEEIIYWSDEIGGGVY